MNVQQSDSIISATLGEGEALLRNVLVLSDAYECLDRLAWDLKALLELLEGAFEIIVLHVHQIAQRFGH